MRSRGVGARCYQNWGSRFSWTLPTRPLGAMLLLLFGLTACQPGGPTAGGPGMPGGSEAPTVGAQSGKTGLGQGAPQAFTATLQLKPYQAEVGAMVEVSGSGYPAGAQVGLVWYSAEGRYELEGIELVGPRFVPTARVLTTVPADQGGNISTQFQVPTDFGGPHDVRGAVDNLEISQAGMIVMPSFSISPREGPVGTMIEVQITGVDWDPQINSWPILYDNRPVGVMTAVTTRGTAVGRLRAAGPVGQHYISIWHNSVYPTPFLNFKDGVFKDVPGAEFSFRATSDPGPAAPVVERDRATGNPFPTGVQSPAQGSAQVSLSTNRVTVGQTVNVRGTNLPANAQLTLTWGSMSGNWTAAALGPEARLDQRRSLAAIQTGADGVFEQDLAIPDDLGGIHRVDVLEGTRVLATAALFIEPSLVSYGPERVRTGDEIKIRVNGLGPATYNNGVYAVTYDNAEIGYVCGQSAGGNIEFTIRATGGPGTHLIDLYPFIWKSKDQAKDAMPRIYGVPLLTYADDHPGRVTPAIRLAVTIVE